MAESADRKVKKLPHIPATYKIHKRPPIRPAIPSPYFGKSSPKVVYVRARTPFVSAVKRVKKLLALAEKREHALYGPTDQEILDHGRGGDIQARRPKLRPTARSASDLSQQKEQVFLKGTGKAIQRALELGLWFQQQPEYVVRLKTGDISVVDDVVQMETIESEPAEASAEITENEAGDAMMTGLLAQSKVNEPTESEAHIPDTRIRKLSVIEIGISRR